ncbi:thermonuclease family protein [Radicibacter daui]|uniref:thermonuclease family protein n=1 Tax=Radicibacter daui TaxID=3064829 RepID=UPI004046FDDA
MAVLPRDPMMAGMERRHFLTLAATGAAVAVLPGAGAHAAGPLLPSGLREIGRGRVVAVTSPVGLSLQGVGAVRLAALEIPSPPLAGTLFAEWPVQQAQKEALGSLAMEQEVLLYSAGPQRQDRHGAALCHLVRARDGLWLQGNLVSSGAARVLGAPGATAGIGALYELEDTARHSRTGLWREPLLGEREAVDYAGEDWPLQMVVIVRGKVLAAAKVGSTVYLNFGSDRRHDFTVRLAQPVTRALAALGFQAEELAGRNIQVRGYAISENGPLIEPACAENLRILAS